MTSFSFTRYRRKDGDAFDPFGRPIVQVSVACPRGWAGLEDTPAEGYLATCAITEYAAPTSPATYIHTRVASTSAFELQATTGKTVPDLASTTDTSAGLALISHERRFYDGPAFAGLPLGQVGQHGVVTRSEALALTDDVLQQAYGAAIPPYLEPSGTPAWTADYPLEFRSLLAKRAGYVFHAGSANPTDPEGYFVTTTRHRYDVHTDPSGRGLLLETLDPLHDAARDPLAHRAVMGYDAFQLLPTTVTDAAGLTATTAHDYRVLQPATVTDANGNPTRFAYSPLGLLTSVWVRGKSPVEGDQLRPSLSLEYGFLAFENSPPAARQPIFVRTTRHVHHDTAVGIPLPDRDETITTVEYSDGFGRLLQTRTEDDDIRFGETHFGGGAAILPAAQSAGPGGDVVGHLNASATHPNVVVSGWRLHDNKGQVVQQYEPFFSEGWAYGEPTEAERGQVLTLFYDPRGHAIRTLMPDGSEQLVVQGVPGTIKAPDVERPETFEPTPWEMYSYDANDNAGRTHPSIAAGYRHHWNTPSSILVDGLGRTVESVELNREAPATPGDALPPIQALRTRTRYDIRGNVLAVIDALGRTAIQNAFDLSNRTLRVDSIDAGRRRSVPDAAGGIVETRAANGSLTLSGYDGLTRPIRLWGRDGSGQSLTLRERLEYGDAGSVGQPLAARTAARAANQLGRLVRIFDEAGQLSSRAYDFKGNLLEKARRVVSDAAVLSVFAGPPPAWSVPAYRVDWTSPSATALDAASYTSTLAYDALNRLTRVTYPEDVEHVRRNGVPAYSRSGALRSVALDGAAFVERIVYNARRQRVLIAYGNGVMTRYAYDPRTFRLLRLRTERFSTPGTLTYRHVGGVLQDLAYEYDVGGNLLAIHDRTPGSGINGTLSGPDALDRTFTYDAAYRLRSANGRECDTPPPVPWDATPRCTDLNRVRPWTEHYSFDVMGSLTELRHVSGGSNVISTFSMASASNRLDALTQGMDVFAYQYDANGNLTREVTSRHLEWDHRNRLRVYRTQTTGSEPTVHAHYLYDSTGHRVKKVVRKPGDRTETTVYVDDIFEHERTVAGGVTQENNALHMMDNHARVAAVRVGIPFPGDATPAVKYHLPDHLGTSTVVLDGAGSIVNREEYTPYGATSFGSFARKRYRFGGHERDAESDLYYAGARYYLPWLGRWASCDPAGTVDGLNLYAYVRNNPMVLKDTTGATGENDYGGTAPPGGPPAENTTSHLRPADHEASTPKPEEPAPPPPAPPTPEEVYAAQQKAAYEQSRAARNSFGQVGKSLVRSLAPATFSATSPSPRLQGVPIGVSHESDPGAQDDIAAAGGNVAKKTVEYGGQAATVVGDVGMAGAQVGVKVIGSIAAEEVPAHIAPQLIQRAGEIHTAVARHMTMQAAEKTTVSVIRATVDGTTHTVVTVNNRKAFRLLEEGVVNLMEHETLGQAPTRFNTWFRRFWGFTNMHSEDLGLRTMKRLGATGGEIATAPWPGCWRCQSMINRLNRLFGDEWVHLNPNLNELPK